MSRNAEDCENSGSLPQLESEPEVEQISEAPEEVPFEIPNKWKWMSFDCVVKTFPSKNYQIQTKEIALEGKYPVISQAKAKIDGYCDDESKLIPRDKIPFVIFGDHTRVVKFVNQQCVIGADGTKLLRSDVYDISFLFYVIVFLAQNLREAGYSRHFKFLKARALPVPPLAEQRRIVARLNDLLALIETADIAYKGLHSLCENFRAKLIQKAIEGKLVPQLESEPEVKQIGEAPEEVPFEIPKKWKWVQLSSAGKIVGGGTPKTGITAYWGGKISWVTPADLGKISGRYISFGAKSITQTGLDNSSARLLPPGSVVYSSRAPIGHIAIAENELCTNQGCKSFVPNLGKIRTEWGYFCLIARTPDIISRASGTTFKEISGSGVGATWIPLPPLAEQRRIVARLNKLLASINQLGD